MKNIKNDMIGIVGGVGPEASNKFCDYLINNNERLKDQDFCSFIHFCNPKIPDRTNAILYNGESPVNEIVSSCKKLVKFGASIIVIPCNTAHYFFDDIQSNVSIPILNMIKITAEYVISKNVNIKKVGILATTGTVKSNLYGKYFERFGVECIYPNDEDQENLVMNSIYGKAGIKAGNKVHPRRMLLEVCSKLLEQGAQALILACTEIPLVISKSDFMVDIYDSMDITSKQIIDKLSEKGQL